MNVNNKPGQAAKRRTGSPRRARRTAQEARAEVLAAARERLLKFGLEGLKITDVARAAGMSHATLLHHFGSSDEMRKALVERMANELLGEFIGMLDEGVPTPSRLTQLFTRLFEGLSNGRHAQLFAWFALSALDHPDELVSAATETRPMVDELLAQMSRNAAEMNNPQSSPRHVALLVVACAIGLGVAGPWLKRVQLLRGDSEVGDFAEWLARFLLAQRSRGD